MVSILFLYAVLNPDVGYRQVCSSPFSLCPAARGADSLGHARAPGRMLLGY
jgi:hypothetical protein